MVCMPTRWAVLISLLATLSFAQAIEGIVLDQQGQPVAGASINNVQNRVVVRRTGADGRFSLPPQQRAVVVRKPGFRSEFVRIPTGSPVRITLLPEGTEAAFPECPSKRKYVQLDGWGAVFRFASMPGIRADRQGHDIDYGVRTYSVKYKAGRISVVHGSGPSWSLAGPLDRMVWPSIKYAETVYSSRYGEIIDARGETPQGRWRHIGRLGESVSYEDVDEAAATILDRFLGGSCVRP